jgi:hypothetical protein
MVTTKRLSGVKADLFLSQAVNGGNILQPGRVSFLSVSTFTAPSPERRPWFCYPHSKVYLPRRLPKSPGLLFIQLRTSPMSLL